mgnify:CR=1 FL=1|tara:strand:- start:60 stop:1100 length:1041 start_codon:yes stop_codon:yes gene_type:complete
MRAGLKNRVNGNQYYLQSNTLSQILSKEGVRKLTFNTRVTPDPNFCAPGGCEDISGALPFNLERRNHYYAPFRQPVKGYRKTLDCSNNNPNCLFTTEIYKDNYIDCSLNLCRPDSYSSLPTSNKPNANPSRARSGISTRAGRPLIRSGMQPNSSGQQNSGLDGVAGNPKKYSYSYRELLNNRRKVTYEKQLPTVQPSGTSPNTSGYGGRCVSSSGCDYSPQTIFKPNNERFMVQGAVDSSDRITRLKLNTIRSGRRCGPTVEEDCRGIYRPGNAQTAVDSVSWPSKNNDYDQVKYKTKFNSNHFEVNYPQVSALARVRGNSSKSKTNFSRNSTICCDDPNKKSNGY